MTQPAQPEELTLDEFLCGCDGPSPWLKQHFDDYISDVIPEWDQDEVTHLSDGYFLAPTENGVLLMQSTDAGMDLVGYYLPPGVVCIRENHQGKGLSSDLILAAYEWVGGPPTEGLDEQCFTKAGYYAHIAAYKAGVEKGLFVQPSSSRPEPGISI